MAHFLRSRRFNNEEEVETSEEEFFAFRNNTWQKGGFTL